MGLYVSEVASKVEALVILCPYTLKYTVKPTQIFCCISPHTGTLQRDGCISRDQMMALFSLYQAAGCAHHVHRLHDAAGLILMI